MEESANGRLLLLESIWSLKLKAWENEQKYPKHCDIAFLTWGLYYTPFGSPDLWGFTSQWVASKIPVSCMPMEKLWARELYDSCSAILIGHFAWKVFLLMLNVQCLFDRAQLEIPKELRYPTIQFSTMHILLEKFWIMNIRYCLVQFKFPRIHSIMPQDFVLMNMDQDTC